jgi:hypothetical protein
MAPVADMVDLLHFLRRSPAQLTPQQATTCHKAALLAIGDHIEGGVPGWMHDTCDEGGMWEYVSEVTAHRMSGQQMQGLYVGLKRQREKEQQAGQGEQPEGQQEGGKEQQEEERVAACMAAAQALMQQQSEQMLAAQLAESEVQPSRSVKSTGTARRQPLQLIAIVTHGFFDCIATWSTFK